MAQTIWSSWCKTASVQCSLLFVLHSRSSPISGEQDCYLFHPRVWCGNFSGSFRAVKSAESQLDKFYGGNSNSEGHKTKHIFLRAVIDWNYYQQSKHLILKGRSVSKLVCKSVSLLLFLTHRLRSFKACVLPYSGPTCTRVQRRHFRFLPICHLSIWNFSTWRIFLHRYLGGIGDKY